MRISLRSTSVTGDVERAAAASAPCCCHWPCFLKKLAICRSTATLFGSSCEDLLVVGLGVLGVAEVLARTTWRGAGRA